MKYYMFLADPIVSALWTPLFTKVW